MTVAAVRHETPGLRADARRNRDKILSVAMQSFASHGVGASLEEIAKAAGVGAGTLYRHFPSREALLVAALQDSQVALRAQACQAQQIADPDAALSAWLADLQAYLRTFNGLPEPVLAAVKQRASPLALSCDELVSITGEFLVRAQQHGQARATITANDLFLSTLGLAWVLNRAESCGASSPGLNAILAHGYLDRQV
ncbi:TetR/AcrR family transcriptional regulator [Devosia sp. A369]